MVLRASLAIWMKDSDRKILINRFEMMKLHRFDKKHLTNFQLVRPNILSFPPLRHSLSFDDSPQPKTWVDMPGLIRS